MSDPAHDDHFQHLLATAKQVQGRLLILPTVAVGGTAAAVYAHHRVSLDVDFVSSHLRKHFDEVLEELEKIPGFKLARVRRPVLILGRIGNDEIGFRQLRRQEELDAVQIDGLWIPSLPEMIRVKSFVLSDRRAVRDYVDVCALVETAGMDNAVAAMEPFDGLYEGLTVAGALISFAEAAYDDPVDAEQVDLSAWRNLNPAYADLDHVCQTCRDFATAAIEAASRNHSAR